MLQVDPGVNQFTGPNLMNDFLPKTELDPDGSMGMYGGPISGPGGPVPNMGPNMGGPNLGPNVPGPNNVNMGPQLTQHSKFCELVSQRSVAALILTTNGCCFITFETD